jgi:hypothetical protein
MGKGPGLGVLPALLNILAKMAFCSKRCSSKAFIRRCKNSQLGGFIRSQWVYPLANDWQTWRL